jgi:glucosamine--fructose-6-phosphate aminotransferase (isomerizing)
MCGIVGYIGERDATLVILNGLKGWNIEATIQPSGILETDISKYAETPESFPGFHSWLMKLRCTVSLASVTPAGQRMENPALATPSSLGMTGDVVMVHNGIVENFLELKEELTAEG